MIKVGKGGKDMKVDAKGDKVDEEIFIWMLIWIMDRYINVDVR